MAKNNDAADVSCRHLWDTQYCQPSQAFSAFREGICRTFMPWSPERLSEQPFEGRLEGVALDDGSIARARMSPIICIRTKSDIAHSPIEGFYANYVISGELKVEQGGQVNIARRGDLVVYDSTLPVKLTERVGSHYEDIAILIAKSRFSMLKNAEWHFGNVLLGHHTLSRPLFDCLRFITANVPTMSGDEWSAHFSAIVSLLPIAVGYFGEEASHDAPTEGARAALRQIVAYVEANLGRKELSANDVAREFGISTRYVQQLFAASGTTFGAYVLERRLNYVRTDMMSPTCRRLPMGMLSARWGFASETAFTLAFKKRFACSPEDYRHCYGQ
jgi:AraC-like DNA-binding protein